MTRRSDDKITPLATLLRAWAHNENTKQNGYQPSGPNKYLVDLLLDAADEIDSKPAPEATAFVAGVKAVESLLAGTQQLCRRDAPCEMCRDLYDQIEALKRPLAQSNEGEKR